MALWLPLPSSFLKLPSPISFMSSLDVVKREFIVFAGELIIETKQQCFKVKITRPSDACGEANARSPDRTGLN